jgi:hypothetical protein
MSLQKSQVKSHEKLTIYHHLPFYPRKGTAAISPVGEFGERYLNEQRAMHKVQNNWKQSMKGASKRPIFYFWNG